MKKRICISLGMIFAFVLWTLLISFVDVKAIGPRASSVGFASLNGYISSKLGVNMTLYTITDWLGLMPIFVAFGFAIFGLCQLVKRRSLFKVDFDILALGALYIAVIGVFVFFEFVPINYRPVLIEGFLEASYPSSTTLLVGTVMPSAAMQMYRRTKKRTVQICVLSVIFLFTAFMIIARLISGVHWFSDIIGGLLASASFVLPYYFLTSGK